MDFIILERVQRRTTGKRNEKVFKNHIRRLRDFIHLGKMTTTTMTTAYRCIYLLLKKVHVREKRKKIMGLVCSYSFLDYFFR